jgi:hypothetical protein
MGDFQGHVIRLYNPFIVTNLLYLYSHSQRKSLLHIYQSPDILINLNLILTNTIFIIYHINILTQMII